MSPRRTAVATAAVRESASSLVKMCTKWDLMVAWETNNALAISSLERPSATSVSTCNSRALRDVDGARIRSILPDARVAVTRSLDDARAWVRDDLSTHCPELLLSGGGDELFWWGVLEQVPGGAGLDGGDDVRFGVVGGQHDNARRCGQSGDLPGGFDAAKACPELQVHQDDVEVTGLGAGDGGLGGGDLVDHDDVELGLENGSQPRAYHGVVVGKEQSDGGHRSSLVAGGAVRSVAGGA